MIKNNTKTHHICSFLLSVHPQPCTRLEILRAVHRDGPSTIPFKETSNHCYFTRYGHGNGGEYSLVTRGFIKVVGKTMRHRGKGGRLLYALTPKGRRYAKAFDVWLATQ